MLLVCVGPDTFHALKKAQELERAYREKYDPKGVSIEKLSDTKPLEAIRSRMGGGLFAQKTFLRSTGLIATWKKADWTLATELFARDVDGTIVVTIEEELSQEEEATIQAWPKAKVYRHSPLTGPAFVRWAQSVAVAEGVLWEAALERFAQMIEGDSWSFWNALPRWKATKTLPDLAEEELSPFLRAEQYLKEPIRERAFVGADVDLLGLFVQQARQALRVAVDAPDPRMPSFAQRKWQRLTPAQKQQLVDRSVRAERGFIRQRQGLIKEGEEVLGS